MANIVKKTYYEILGVHHTATKQQIKSAYLKLAKSLHPDLQEGKKAKLTEESEVVVTNSEAEQGNEAVEEFKAVTEAYEVLSNVDERKKYDSQVLKLFDASEYYFGNLNTSGQATNTSFRFTNKKSSSPSKIDAIFLKKFQEELEYRRRRRYMSGIDFDELDMQNRRHFFHTSQLFYDQFKPPKIKNWNSSLTQDAAARSIRLKQIVLLFAASVAFIASAIILRLKMLRWFNLPTDGNYQDKLYSYYAEKGVKFGKKGIDEGLPSHKL